MTTDSPLSAIVDFALSPSIVCAVEGEFFFLRQLSFSDYLLRQSENS